MSHAADDVPVEQPEVTPTVSTAPARSRWQLSRIPAHLGPARTSTVVLAVLFLAIGTLYLNIRPEPTGTTTSGTTGVTDTNQPAPTYEPTAPTTTDTTAPTTTDEVPTTTDTTTPGATSGTGTPSERTGTSATRTTQPTTETSVPPTTSAPAS